VLVAGVLAATTVLSFGTQARAETTPPAAGPPGSTPPAAAPMDPAPAPAPPAGAPTQPVGPVVKTPAAPKPKPIDCRRVKCVALTFDDGPGPYTKRLLATLRKEKVHATFFSVGEMVAARPQVEKQIAKAGHEIGNHSWSHPDLAKLTNAAITSQVSRTAHQIAKATGRKPTLMRPPYGAYTPRVRSLIGGAHDAVVLWSVDPLDWKYRNSNSVYNRVTSQTKPGSIVLMHDIHSTTVAAVPRIIATLRARHYHFVTVSELYGGHLKAGHVYSGREAAYHPKAKSPTKAKTPTHSGAAAEGGAVFTDPGDEAGDQRGGGVANGNTGNGGSVGPGEDEGAGVAS
jgi:peptidoglycan/xylan/chitin deacetylase (PgdA/CDA1 family)